MSNVVRLFKDRVFDPETIKLLVDVYDQACANSDDTAKELIAKRIINKAESGERDPSKLLGHALLGLQWTSPTSARDVNVPAAQDTRSQRI